MKIVTINQMRQIEKEGFEAGITYEEMIQTVGLKIADILERDYCQPGNAVLGLIGKGNNGNDCLAALTELSKRGQRTMAFLFANRSADDSYLTQYLAQGGTVESLVQDSAAQTLDTVLDGVYGIGFHLPLDPAIKTIFGMINQRSRSVPLIALDCPSGMDCDSGKADGNCLKADLTIYIEAIKIGQVKLPAYLNCGTLTGISLDLPKGLAVYSEIQRSILELKIMRETLPERSDTGHKGSFGAVTIIGGSENYIGAARMAGIAAFRSGCGFVNMIVPEIVRNLNAGGFSQAVWFPQDFSNPAGIEQCVADLQNCMERKGSFLIGPGLGQSWVLDNLLKQILQTHKSSIKPVIFDADALNYLSRFPEWLTSLPDNTILTPHSGEMARLCDVSIDEIEANRFKYAEEKAENWQVVVVLKGPLTIIAAPTGESAVMPYASSALAKAGSGDMLAGLIAGFAAQGASPFDAACLGVWVHANAARIAVERLGQTYSLMADDLIEAISDAIREIC
jgi:NAD(P)H-hydrate epimerase